MFLEILTFVVIALNIVQADIIYQIKPSNLFIVSLLMATLLLKYLLGFTIIRAYYLVLIIWGVNGNSFDVFGIVILFLVSLNLLLEVLSRI